MRAAILAGGKGTRIAQYYPDIPKPMIPLAGKPVLQHQIESLVAQGIVDITLIIGYKADVIKKHFGNGSSLGASIQYIIEDSPLGTGGALPSLPKEDTLILLGDIYCDIDFTRLIAFHRAHHAAITLFVHPNSHPHDSDLVMLDDKGRVTAWKPKKSSTQMAFRNIVNAGIYLFSASALPSGAMQKKDLEQDIIIPQIPSGKVFGYRSTEWVKDMGTPERLAQIEKDIKSGITAARSMRNRQKAIFLDRDGTINVHDGYITKSEQLKLIAGVSEAIRRINQSEYLAICVTNQPIIARGDVTFEELEAIHAKLDMLLGEQGTYLDDLLFCPHHPDKGFDGERAEYKIDCFCRKPKPGLLIEAAKRHNVDLSQSWMIGDSDRDVQAGQAAGCKTLQIAPPKSLLDYVGEIIKSY